MTAAPVFNNLKMATRWSLSAMGRNAYLWLTAMGCNIMRPDYAVCSDTEVRVENLSIKE
jgi:hypothetical protein